MFDTIKTMIAQALGHTDAEVEKVLSAIREKESRGGPYATASENAEGSSTSLSASAEHSQIAFSKLRKRCEQELPAALALVLATELARERRDDAQASLARHQAQQRERRATDVHPSFRKHLERLLEHGVYPDNVKQHRAEEVAILADLTKWKASDARHSDPDNPWRAILAIYSSRLIRRAEPAVTVKRSVSGEPTLPSRPSDPRHYMFGPFLADHPASTGNPPAPAISAVPAVASADVPVEQVLPSALAPVAGPERPKTNPKAVGDVDVGNVAETLSQTETVRSVSPQNEVGRAIDPDRAHSIAKAVFTNPAHMDIYWPKGWSDRNDFESARLISALEALVASPITSPGAELFLAAVKESRGRAFIEGRRDSMIAALARKLVEGDEKTLERIRRAGFEI